MLDAILNDESWGERKSQRIANAKCHPSTPLRTSPGWSHVSKKEVEDLYEPDGLAIEGDAAAEMCPEEHVLNQRKKRQFVQLLYECLGIPPEFHHDGSFCWAGPKGTVATVRSLLPFDIDTRAVTTVMRRTWEAWATGDIDIFDAGVMEHSGAGTTKRRGRKRMMTDDEIQLALQHARVDGLDIARAAVNDLRKMKREGYTDKDGTIFPPIPTHTPVGWSTVHAAVKSWGVVCHKRQTRKTGSRDALSLWAVSRHHFAIQLKEQFSDIQDSERTPGWQRLDKC